MLRSTMRKLAKCLTTTSRRPARVSTRQAALAVEGLEDRMVLSTATQVGSTLVVVADPGRNLGIVSKAPSVAGTGSTINQPRPITFQVDQANRGLLDVLDSGTLLGKFAISSIKTVDVSVAGLDAINVDDSNGLPFASGTNMFLFGSASNTPNSNSLNLTGSGTISGGETYIAGSGPREGELFVGGATFNFSGAIGSVTDAVKTTSPLVVTSSSQGAGVTLSGQNGGTQQFTGLADGGGGGGTLTFSNKSQVDLVLTGTGSSVALNATAAATGEKFFEVEMVGTDDALFINATPSGVTTTAYASGLENVVEMRGNSGQVFINGGYSTLVSVGSAAAKATTSGIKQNVSVHGVGTLDVFDSGNVTTKENVTVTESTISGTGLFGNDAVVLNYNAASLSISTGQLANTYTVVGSHPGARFGNQITIEDGSTKAGLSVRVAVDSGSALNLSLLNYEQVVNGSLLISALDGAISPSVPAFGTGTETMTFAGGLTSTVFYAGFNSVAFA